jgi:hypothetical protein
MQFQIVYRFENRLRQYDLKDPTQMVQAFAQLRAWIANQREFPHQVHENTSALFGYGYCDQINAIAGVMLSKVFQNVELIGLTGRFFLAGHSILKIYDQNPDEALYVDIWSPHIIAFKILDHRTVPLATTDLYASQTYQELNENLYAIANEGYSFLHIYHNLPRFFWSMLTFKNRNLKLKTIWSTPPSPKNENQKISTNQSASFNYQEFDPKDFKRFIDARLKCLYGENIQSEMPLPLNDLTKKISSLCRGSI